MRDEELEIDKEAIVTRKEFVMIEMCAYMNTYKIVFVNVFVNVVTPYHHSAEALFYCFTCSTCLFCTLVAILYHNLSAPAYMCSEWAQGQSVMV